jgi:hypothetical protein
MILLPFYLNDWMVIRFRTKKTRHVELELLDTKLTISVHYLGEFLLF